MTIKGLMVDPITNMPIIILKSDDEKNILPIWVGIFEANAIALKIEKIDTPRPMTHDLLKNIIQELSFSVKEIIISELKDSTFYALINLELNGKTHYIDARPSDAIALALRTEAPILVEEEVIEQAKSLDFSAEDSERLKSWFENLSKDDMGKYEM